MVEIKVTDRIRQLRKLLRRAKRANNARGMMYASLLMELSSMLRYKKEGVETFLLYDSEVEYMNINDDKLEEVKS